MVRHLEAASPLSPSMGVCAWITPCRFASGGKPCRRPLLSHETAQNEAQKAEFRAEAQAPDAS